MMKRIRSALIGFLVLGAVVYFMVPALLLPSGVWRRRVVRESPLKAPTAITSVRGDTLISANQEFRIAGVTLPSDGELSTRATDFLRVVTSQGVEVIRPVQPEGTFVLRCEPRIWHWCGNDSVKAHYEQFNLNELVVAFGYATFNPAARGLTDNEGLRLRGAEVLAKERHRGLWTQQPGATERTFRPNLGLNISDALGLETFIEFAAAEIAEH
jgi:endonuclease YncB( thermonuclease family)